MATATKFDWQTCDEPAEMREHIKGSISDHKAECFVRVCESIVDELSGERKHWDFGNHPLDWRFNQWLTSDRWETILPLKERADILRELFPPPKSCPKCGNPVIKPELLGHDLENHSCCQDEHCGFVSDELYHDWIAYPFDLAWRTPTVIGLTQKIDGIESGQCQKCFGHGRYDWYPEDDPTNSRLEGGISTKCCECNGAGQIETLGEPDFSAMPILADALEEAGCEDERILRHCRGIPARCDGGCEFHPEWGLFCTYEMAGPDSRWVTCKRCAGSGEKEPQPHLRGCWVIDLILERE